MTDDRATAGMSEAELEAEGAIALPDKEVVSILDLNADLNLAIDAAAPIDLAVAANANVAAPIDAAVGANILSDGSTAAGPQRPGRASSTRTSTRTPQRTAAQDSTIDQSNDVVDAGSAARRPGRARGRPGRARPDPGGTDRQPIPPPPPRAAGSVAGALDGNLLNVDVNLDADADIAAPINGAIAANANVAAPIDAAVAANIGSVDSDADRRVPAGRDHQPEHRGLGQRHVRPESDIQQ